MSMILDAMKRSKEGETRTSDVPTVDTVHYVPEPEPRFSRWQVAGMLAIAVVLIAAVLIAMWPSEPESNATASSKSRSSASTIIPSSDSVMAPASVPQGIDQRVERPAEQQLEANESITAEVPPSNSLQRASVESPAQQTPAVSTNQDRAPAAAPVTLTPPQHRERPGVARSAPPSAQVTTQAAKPAAGSDELRAIYQALKEEASQTAAPEASRLSNSAAGAAGAVGRGGNEFDVDGLARSVPNTLRERSARDNTDGASPEEPGEAPPIDFADILAAAQEELGVKPLVESSEPLLETLSQQIKDDIPSLIYSEHRYDPAGSSSVTLNGKTVKERQRVGAFTVIEILPDSVVLRWRETQFRVRARNSWVNM